MKALIVTINDGLCNYGNKLQNYAVTVILKKNGVISKTLNFEKNFLSSKHAMERLKAFIHKTTMYKLCKNKSSEFYFKYEVARIQSFDKFQKKYLPQHFDKNLNKSNNYDYYVVGSDQVWNPEFFKYHPKKEEAYLLTFCDDNKKICFSPSFGVSRLPKEWVDKFKINLKKIKYISVRESQGVEIVHDLVSNKVIELMDPTLMLDSNEWLKISHQPMGLSKNDKYILKYFIGEENDDINNYIKNIAQKQNLKIHSIWDEKDKQLYPSGPAEFIYAIANASIIFTDSFHACAFSIIFKKDFYVFDRKSKYADMSSRISSLLHKFNLESQFGNIKNYDLVKIDYKNVYDILKEERKKYNQYIEETIGSRGET